MSFWRLRGKSEPVDEHATVVLKRQVPIRFDEAPRSWLGGLPMMPKGAKWPRGGDGQPLHFLAQIACADLSKALWEGRGPRQGWLLLFVDVLSERDEFDDGAVQVLHTAELGVEHEPPPDMPTVRHLMTDYIYLPEVRPGVPKLWRKWPVDIVIEGATAISAQELYDAPVTESLYAYDAVQLDRPLTWRGALYYVEGVVRDIARDIELKLGNSDVLMRPPELDRDAFQEEYERRAAGRAEFQDREVGWGHRVEAARIALTAEIAAERRAGWIAHGFEALDKRQAKLEAECVEWRRRVEETPEGDETQTLYRNAVLADKTKELAAVKGQRADLRRLAQSYPGPEEEARLNAEIEDLGAKRLQWLGERRAALNGVMSRILAQSDLGAALPEAEWRAIEASVEAPTSAYWENGAVPRKVEKGLTVNGRHMNMALREDFLDVYTRDGGTHAALDADFTAEMEKKIRYFDYPHRMGDMPSPDERFLFQIPSDAAMGWIWNHVGMLFVTISPSALSRCRFDKVRGWVAGVG